MLFFFFRNATTLCGKQQANIHIFFMSKSVEAFAVLWFFFSLLLILRRLRRDPEKTFWNGPELAVWLFGNPLLLLGLFYNLIKSALCFATFQALISGLGRVKRPRQFEKGSLRHKEAACSQSFPSSTPPRQKKKKESERASGSFTGAISWELNESFITLEMFMTFPLNSLSHQLMADSDRLDELSWPNQIKQGKKAVRKIFQTPDTADMFMIY